MSKNPSVYKYSTSVVKPRVSVQRVKSLGGHFACLCRGFEFNELKRNFVIIFQKGNGNTFRILSICYCETSSKSAK